MAVGTLPQTQGESLDDDRTRYRRRLPYRRHWEVAGNELSCAGPASRTDARSTRTSQRACDSVISSINQRKEQLGAAVRRCLVPPFRHGVSVAYARRADERVAASLSPARPRNRVGGCLGEAVEC